VMVFSVGLALALECSQQFTDSSLIFFTLAVISATSVLTVKVLAVFVHGPEMKKFSLKATMAESSYESAIQLIFVILISLWADKVSPKGLMSMLSSIVMIGKSSAENYLTFGSKNLLSDASLGQQLRLLATTSPVFILTAIFRIGSFSLICAKNHWLASLRLLPITAVTVHLFLLFLKSRNHLKDLAMGNMGKSSMSEFTTISLWGHRGREKSRNLQMGMAAFFLLLYTCFLTHIIIFPDEKLFGMRKALPTYHPNPATLQICSVITLCLGWIAFGLQILQQKKFLIK